RCVGSEGTESCRQTSQPALRRQQDLPRVGADEEIGPEGNDDQDQRGSLETWRQVGDEERQGKPRQRTEENGQRAQRQTFEKDERVQGIEPERPEPDQTLVILQR